MRLPAQIEAKILAYTGMDGLTHRTKSLYTDRLRSVREEMRRLSADFRIESASVAKYSDAYFLYNFPSNVAKTIYVMTEIKKLYPHLFVDRPRFRVLDVGCGDGAGMVGLYHALKGVDEEVHFHFNGIDSSKKMLKRAEKILYWHRKQDRLLKTIFRHKDARDFRDTTLRKKYDIILFINSLAEIVEGDVLPRDFMGRLYGSIVEGGLLVIIEPALKKFARRLMALRDELARHKTIEVILPCLHDAPCPLVQVDNRREWCHQSVAWSPPEYLRIINQGLNREIDVLKFAYVAAVKTKTPLSGKRGYRVVSHLLKEKGRTRCFLCTPRGRVELVRLHKARNIRNKEFDEVKKGSIVNLDNVSSVKPDYWEVTGKTVVDLTE